MNNFGDSQYVVLWFEDGDPFTAVDGDDKTLRMSSIEAQKQVGAFIFDEKDLQKARETGGRFAISTEDLEKYLGVTV